jgi:hypothetical protein
MAALVAFGLGVPVRLATPAPLRHDSAVTTLGGRAGLV